MIQKPRPRSRAIPYPAREAVLALLAGFAFLAAAVVLLAPSASGQVFSSQPYVAAPDPAVEALRARLNAMEAELKAAIDRGEKLAYDLAQLRRSADAASKAAQAEIDELKARVQSLEAGGGAGVQGDAALTRGNDPVVVTGSRVASVADTAGLASVDVAQLPQDEEGLLKESNELLLKKELGAAQQSAETFLTKYSKSKNADEAQYILAEAMLYQDNYAEAASAYGKVVSQYPKSDKAPYSLVKLARAMRLMDKKTEACKSLELMAKQYPNAPANAKALATTERKNANCK
jgi:tol-pal system protein YbgF